MVVRDEIAGEKIARPARLAHIPRDYTLRRLLAVADVVGVTAALGVAVLAGGTGDRLRQFGIGLLLLPLWILVFKAYGLYDRDGKRVSHSTIDDVPWLFHALLSGTLALALLTRGVPLLRLHATGVGLFLGVALLAVFVARAAARAVACRLVEPDRALFVGGGPMARLLVEKIRSHREYGLDPIGFIDGVSPVQDGSFPLPYLGEFSRLESICRDLAVQRIVVASPELDEPGLAELVRVANDLSVRVSLVPQLSDVLGSSLTVDDVEGITVLSLNPPALGPSSRLLKRAMDVSISAVALLLMLPLLCLIAALVKITSRGPVFYRQERIGRDGRRFRMCKFRTMVADAEQREDELRKLSRHPAWLLVEHDPRVTRIGRVLRKLSLDELPQLWNVLYGDMSLVGPRPMPPEVDEHINGWGRRRLDLTPGITGLWQVLGRASIPFEEMVRLDYLYVTNWSLWQDIRLLIRTLPAVVKQRGAN